MATVPPAADIEGHFFRSAGRSVDPDLHRADAATCGQRIVVIGTGGKDEVRQNGSTANLIFDVPTLISYLVGEGERPRAGSPLTALHRVLHVERSIPIPCRTLRTRG